MKNLLSFLLLISFGISYSQINVEEIKQNVIENPQKYYYDYLEIFKTNPKSLTAEQLNYVYYGNNYVDYGFKRLEFNKELDEVTKFSKRNISSKKAKDILEKALVLYEKNPLNKELLEDLQILYSKIGDGSKSDLHYSQSQLLYQIIKNSGTGKSDISPIVVTSFSNQWYAVENYSGIFSRGIDFESKVLSDGSWLNVFKNGTNCIL